MEDQITLLEDLLMEYTDDNVSPISITDYDDDSFKWRKIFDTNCRYYNVWGTSSSNSNEIIELLEEDYDKFEKNFKSYLDDNEIEYVDVEILSNDDGDIIFSVTIEII